MEQFTIFMTVLLLGMVTRTSTACSDPQTFGDNCEYQCHCAGGQACGTDGSCSNGCAAGWEGEYCQRGNVAAGRSSSTSQSTTDGSYSSSLALDGNTNQAVTSCSRTRNQDHPWWQVDLGREYVLFTVKIWKSNEVDVTKCKTTQKGTEYRGTMSTTRKGFTCADWLDETIHPHFIKPANSYNYCRNPDHDREPWCFTTDEGTRYDYCDVPWCPGILKNLKIKMDSHICHQNTGAVGFSASPEYRCDTPVVGRFLKIQLMTSSTVLALCEVAVQAFQYGACQTKHYGPNCNNRCQCANDAKCNDKTGGCPNGVCNDRFTGPYCNIEIPTILKNTGSTPTSISLRLMFNRPHDSAYDAGKVTFLHIRYNSTADSSAEYDIASPSPVLYTADLTPLQPSTQYSVRVRVQYSTSKDGTETSPLGPITNLRTESCSGYMVMPMITLTSNTIVAGPAWPNRVSLVVNAEVPTVPGMIVECNKQLKVYIKKTSTPSYAEITKTGLTYVMDRLTAFTDYDIKAIVRGSDGKEKDHIKMFKTAEDVPSAPTIAKAAASPISISVRITPPDPPYGVITNYSIEMWEANSTGKTYTFEPTDMTNFTHTFNELNYSTTYHFKAKASTSVGFGNWSKKISITTSEDSSSAVLAVGLTFGFLVILAAVIPVAVIFIRRRQAADHTIYEQPMTMKGAPRHEDANIYEELHTTALHARATSHDIPSTNEAPVYENFVAGGSRGPHIVAVGGEGSHGKVAVIPNEEDEDSSPDNSQKSMLVIALVSEIQGKRLKQEFMAIAEATIGPGSTDIIPFDFNQVKIGDGKGNINASFIKANDKAIAYIAAKDPEKGMADEMWEMIWQNQCTAVVMLTTPSEDNDKGKMYWHSEGSAIYGEITVTALEEEEADGCIRRTFKLSKGSQIQLVMHLQLLKWPGESRRSRVLLDMLENVSRHFVEAGPLLVHCGDGSDRTGTFIALDILIKKVESADGDFSYRHVNVVDCIKILREQRPGMVSSLSHYKFIHDALVEHFLVGRTAIERANFMEEFGELSNLLRNRDCSRMEELLQLLAYFTPPISSLNFTAANASVNITKNRDRDVVADDDHRVKLVSSTGNDYINAVFVQGYNKPPYIVTQMPLPNTKDDFWKLVRDEGVTTIVMLNQEEEASAVYWPKKGKVQEHETFSVKCIETNSHHQVTTRDFKFVSNKLWKKESIVRQFQLLNWPEDDMVASNLSTIVQLVNSVDKWNSTNPKAKIIVHCRNGAKQSGMFCVAHAAIAQMKSENEVDIFNLTREVIACRPQFSDCWQLLEFVHEVVGEYLINNEN